MTVSGGGGGSSGIHHDTTAIGQGTVKTEHEVLLRTYQDIRYKFFNFEGNFGLNIILVPIVLCHTRAQLLVSRGIAFEGVGKAEKDLDLKLNSLKTFPDFCEACPK